MYLDIREHWKDGLVFAKIWRIEIRNTSTMNHLDNEHPDHYYTKVVMENQR